MSTRFQIDTWVEYLPGVLSPAGRFKVLRELPAEDDEFRYRLKGENESFERVAYAYALRLIKPPALI